MYLSEVKTNKEYSIKSLHKLGRRLQKRLLDLGITGCVLKVILNNNGPVLVEIRGTRIAIGRGMAKKIDVEEIC